MIDSVTISTRYHLFTLIFGQQCDYGDYWTWNFFFFYDVYRLWQSLLLQLTKFCDLYLSASFLFSILDFFPFFWISQYCSWQCVYPWVRLYFIVLWLSSLLWPNTYCVVYYYFFFLSYTFVRSVLKVILLNASELVSLYTSSIVGCRLCWKLNSACPFLLAS